MEIWYKAFQSKDGDKKPSKQGWRENQPTYVATELQDSKPDHISERQVVPAVHHPCNLHYGVDIESFVTFDLYKWSFLRIVCDNRTDELKNYITSSFISVAILGTSWKTNVGVFHLHKPSLGISVENVRAAQARTICIILLLVSAVCCPCKPFRYYTPACAQSKF